MKLNEFLKPTRNKLILTALFVIAHYIINIIFPFVSIYFAPAEIRKLTDKINEVTLNFTTEENLPSVIYFGFFISIFQLIFTFIIFYIAVSLAFLYSKKKGKK